jgi:hypothetical protein
MAIPRHQRYLGDHQKFSESICKKVHAGLHVRTRGNAEAILARNRMNGGVELSSLEKFELENVARSKNK